MFMTIHLNMSQLQDDGSCYFQYNNVITVDLRFDHDKKNEDFWL